MITIFCWNSARQCGEWLDPARLRGERDALSRADCLWIDLDRPTPEEEQLVYGEFLPVHPLSREDITRLRREPDSPPHLPKVEEFPDYLFVIVNPLTERLLGQVQRRLDEVEFCAGPCVTQLSAVLTPHVLITHHEEPVPSIQELRTYLTKHAAQAQRGPDFLFHLVLDTMVDHYAPVLDAAAELLDNCETQVLARPTQQLLERLLRLKRGILNLRKTLIHEREILARLCRGEFQLIDPREMAYYRNVYDHLIRFTELTESAREMASDLLQTHLAATSNKLNEVMKVLTMISTIILPMTLIAGIYGMNFERMPELHWPLGYPFALALMSLTALAALAFFRWRKWI